MSDDAKADAVLASFKAGAEPLLFPCTTIVAASGDECGLPSRVIFFAPSGPLHACISHAELFDSQVRELGWPRLTNRMLWIPAEVKP